MLARCGQRPLVVLEATYGWYWAADVLAEAGAEVHLAHPLGVKAFSCRRVKNDERDASDLADLLRMGRLPEAWIAPAEVRALREVVRYRHKLVQQRTSCKDQVHAVLAKLGVPVTHSRRVRPRRRAVAGPAGPAGTVCGQGGLAARPDRRAGRRDRPAGRSRPRRMLAAGPGYAAVRELDGIGPVLAAVIIAEIGDVTRFRKAGQLCSWAGLTPRHYESDTKVIRGHVSKQGSRMLRWALIEAIQHQPAGTRPRAG